MKVMPYLTVLFVCIILFQFVVWMLPFRVELSNPYAQFVVEQLFPLALLGLSFLAILNSRNDEGGIRWGLFLPAVLLFVVGFGWLYFTTSWGGVQYQDAHVKLQSLDDPRQKVLVQYLDEGALGSHYREIYAVEYLNLFRTYEEFQGLQLKGKWVKYSNGRLPDTLSCNQTFYQSELFVDY